MTDLVGAGRQVDADRLLTRVQAIGGFLRAVDGHLPEDRLVSARTVVERAGQRLALSRDHTVVALAGSTGSGKSSLFNALARMDLSPAGARRPTTSATYACVWGSAPGAAALLDWLGMLPRHRFARESALDGEAEVALRGLVLLDLPDFDSIEAAHRTEVDRLLGLVDLVVWVVDPQKYADRLIHHSYLRHFSQHREVTAVALNHCDRLSGSDVQRCLTHLRELLDADGLPGVTTLASSAYGSPGHDELRGLLERTVAARKAALHRLAADVEQVAAELSTMVGPEVTEQPIDRSTARILTGALAEAAGVSALVKAAEHTYRRRAAGYLRSPPLRWLGRLRPDPLRRLHRQPGPADTVAATSLPELVQAQRAAVGLAVRALAERAAGVLPAPWPTTVNAAARSRLDVLPDALEQAVAGIDIGPSRTPLWWRLVAGVQWLAFLGVIAGLGWLLAGYGLPALGLPEFGLPAPGLPPAGPVPLPALLLLGGALLGIGAAALGRPLVTAAARRARARTQSRLRTAVAEVAQEYVVTPVSAVLAAYEQARVELAVAAENR